MRLPCLLFLFQKSQRATYRFLLEVTVQQALLGLTSFISFASVRKHESSVIPLLVLSESNPLCWALIR